MQRILLGLTLSSLIVAPAAAQERAKTQAPQQPASASPSDLGTAMTPAIWYYLREQERWDDPKQVIRRNAEYRAAQRRARIESSRWFGYSRLRPPASPVPMMGTYSPHWVGNSYNPFHWTGSARSGGFIYPSAIYR